MTVLNLLENVSEKILFKNHKKKIIYFCDLYYPLNV